MKIFLQMVMLAALFLFYGSLYGQDLPIVQYTKQENIVLVSDFVHEDSYTIKEDGVSFVKVHFSKFNIPKGVIVEISNLSGTEKYTYSKYDTKRSTKQRGDGPNSFSPMSISGDTAVINVIGYKPNKHIGSNLVIDSVTFGFPEEEIQAMMSDFTESTCGADNNRLPIECYKDSFPKEYERTKPVARIINGSGSLCTAWRVGPDNRMLTNNHCNQTQEQIAAAEVWFHYEYNTCSPLSGIKPGIVKVPGQTLLSTSHEFDYTLFTVGNFDLIQEFGYFGLEPRDPVLGERIYISGHGEGRPKQLVIEDDLSDSGLCNVDDTSRNGFGIDSDMGYYCDSIGGQSGSPVLTPTNNRAIALHHFGGCMNQGIKFSRFWPEIAIFFDGIVPFGDDEPVNNNHAPISSYKINCTFGQCDFDGSASSDQEGAIVEYTWTFGDGNTTTTTTPFVSNTYNTTGIYQTRLRVTDEMGLYGYNGSQAVVTLEGENINPVANWSYTSVADYVINTTNLSYDPDGTIVKYEWSVRDSGVYKPLVSTDKDLTYTFGIGGPQIVYLRVYDDKGGSATSNKWVNIVGPIINERPVGSFTTTSNGYQTFTFTDTSTDPDDTVSSWYWTFVSYAADGTTWIKTSTSTEQNPSTTFFIKEGETTGLGKAQLIAYDSYGASSIPVIKKFTTSLAPVAGPPVADFSYIVSRAKVSFTDTSVDDKSIATWAWNFGDGSTSSLQNPVHTYVSSPPYFKQFNVTLTVTDVDGFTDVITKLVSVDTSPATPVANFTFVVDKDTVDFTDTSTDDDNDITEWDWNFGDGDTSILQNPSHTYIVPAGQYTASFDVGLTATDSTGLISSKYKTVAVDITPTIDLTYSLLKADKGYYDLNLRWSNSPFAVMEIRTWSGVIATVPTSVGSYTTQVKRNSKGDAWWVCAQGTNICSNKIMLSF